MLRALIDWVDSRTGIRAARAHLLDEPIPAGTGWSFVTGSVVLFLILVQLATGVVLTRAKVDRQAPGRPRENARAGSTALISGPAGVAS